MKTFVSLLLVVALLWTIVPESAGDLPNYNDGTTGTINVGTINILTNVNAAAGVFTNSLTLGGSSVLTSQTNVAGANPSATIGGTVQNGSALTFMRSDAVPALSSTVIITNGSTGTPLTINGNGANTWLLTLNSNGVSIGGFTNNGQLLLPNALVGTPSIAASAQPNTGIYFANNAIQFAVAGARYGYFDNTPSLTLPGGTYLNLGGSSFVSGAGAGIFLGQSASSPINQVVQSCNATGTDHNGSSLTIEPGQSTGSGVPGDLIYRTSLYTNSSGSTANAYTTRGQIVGRPCALTNATATSFQRFTMATNTQAGIQLFCTVGIVDASFNRHSLSTMLIVDAINVNGTITATINPTAGSTASNTGTLTTAYTVVDEGSNVLAIRCNANTSLTATIEKVKWTVSAINSDGAITVTPVQL